MKRIYVILFFFSFVLIYSCATSKITSTWKAPDAVAKYYEKLMVVGIIREADRNLRIKMENHLVDDLKALGYNALSSYQVYGPKAFDSLNEVQINQRLAKEGIDGVITIVLLDKEKEEDYAAGIVINSPYLTYRDRFEGYYRNVYSRIGTPGYYTVTTKYYRQKTVGDYTVNTKYYWESNLYDLATNKLMYSIQTQSFDPGSSESLGHEYGKLIVENLSKTNLLQKQQQIKAM